MNKTTHNNHMPCMCWRYIFLISLPSSFSFLSISRPSSPETADWSCLSTTAKVWFHPQLWPCQSSIPFFPQQNSIQRHLHTRSPATTPTSNPSSSPFPPVHHHCHGLPGRWQVSTGDKYRDIFKWCSVFFFLIFFYSVLVRSIREDKSVSRGDVV